MWDEPKTKKGKDKGAKRTKKEGAKA